MAAQKKTKGQTKASDTRSFEAQLWEACEAQRGSMNASRYKDAVLGVDNHLSPARTSGGQPGMIITRVTYTDWQAADHRRQAPVRFWEMMS